jgi:hypothetical protein
MGGGEQEEERAESGDEGRDGGDGGRGSISMFNIKDVRVPQRRRSLVAPSQKLL